MRVTGGWDNPLRANPVPGDVIACLDELGIEVFRVEGDEAKAQCPAHFNRTGKVTSRGDWSVNTDDGMHNCFSCGFSGYFVEVVVEVLDCSREDAVAWVRQRGGIDRVRKVFGKGSFIEELVADQVDESDLALFIDVPEDVCAERGISPGAADEYRVLWDPDKRLWITCIRDENDRLMGWQAKNKRYFHNHPEHLEKGRYIYGINDIPADCNVGIVVEAPLDCPYILSAGVVGAVSTMGAGITDTQLDILCDRFDVLISALDDDTAGDKTNRELRKRVNGRATLRFWNYGRGNEAKDPGEQSYEQVQRSYETAYSSLLARF